MKTLLKGFLDCFLIVGPDTNGPRSSEQGALKHACDGHQRLAHWHTHTKHKKCVGFLLQPAACPSPRARRPALPRLKSSCKPSKGRTARLHRQQPATCPPPPAWRPAQESRSRPHSCALSHAISCGNRWSPRTGARTRSQQSNGGLLLRYALPAGEHRR